MDLPIEEKAITSSLTSGCKTPQSANAKTEPKQLKRKLFSQQGGSADEEENKKGSTPKRRKSVHSDAGSPPALTPGSAANKTPGRLSVPLSERQQMALIMQQYANSETTTQGDTSPRPSSPQSVGKKTPLDKKIHKKNEKGETMLHIAAIKGDAKQCKKLIKAGADVNVRDNAGWTPLHEACNHGYFTIAKQLLKNGANVNVQGCDNDTPLHDASGNGHVKLVELLLRHGANPLQANTRGKAPIDIAANDTILKLLKSETIASSSSGDSITSEIRSPTSPESMSDDDEKTKKDGETFFSPNPRALSTHLPAYAQQSSGNHGSTHSPTSTSRVASPPKVDPYDFSDSDTANPSTHLSGTPQRLTLKLMKQQKEKREDMHSHSPKRGGLSSGLHGSYHSSAHDEGPPTKRFKSFTSRMEESATKYTPPSATSKFDKQTPLDRLSPASFSSQDSDLIDPKLDISAFSSGKRETIGLTTGTGNLNFPNVSKVSSSDSILSGHRTADSKHKTGSRYGKESDSTTQPDSQMPKLSQESGAFSPDSGDDSDENALQIDIDSTVPSSKPTARESIPSNKQSHSHHVGSSSATSHFHGASHSHNKSDVSSTNSDNSKSRFSSLSRRSPSPFRFTDSPTSSISPGQSLYSNKERNTDKFKDSNATSTTSLGYGSKLYEKNKNDRFDSHKHDKSKHARDPHASSTSTRQSPQSMSDTLIKKEPVDHSSEVSQSCVKSSVSGKTYGPDSSRHNMKTEKDTTVSSKTGDTKILPKLVPKQEPKEEGSSNRHSPISSSNVKLESKEHGTIKVEKDKAVKQEPCDTRSPKQEKESGGKTSPKTAPDTNRFSPKPHAKDSGAKHGASQPGTSPVSQHKWDSNRASPKPDRGDRDSPKSDKSDKSDNLKVPPLKIIMPAKVTPSSDHRHVPSTKTTTSARSGNLPYVVNPTQDGTEGVVGSTGTPAEGASLHQKQSRSSSRASSVASGGAEKEHEAVEIKNEDSNHGVSSTQQDGVPAKRSRRTERDGPRTEDEESRDGSSKGERSDKGGGDAEKSEDTSERRVTRSQVRSQKGHHPEPKDVKDHQGKEENGKDGSGSEKEKADGTSGDKDGAGSTKGSNHGNQKEEETIHIHPRKRKLRQRQQQENNSTVDLSQFNFFPRMQTQDKTSNPYEMYLDIRKKVAKRRLEMAVITPKAPQGFKDYLMVNCNYVLQGNASKLTIPLLTPPSTLEGALKELFIEQEKARYKLRLQHLIEREKLMLSIEQEIVREHGRAARALANQTTPLSVCAVLRDEEIYNPITDDKDKSGARQRYNGRQFLSWLQDVDDKYEKIKESLLMRHHHEAESLNAVQKLEWEWKLKDSMLWDQKSNPTVNEAHVPMVQVNDEFELLPS